MKVGYLVGVAARFNFYGLSGTTPSGTSPNAPPKKAHTKISKRSARTLIHSFSGRGSTFLADLIHMSLLDELEVVEGKLGRRRRLEGEVQEVKGDEWEMRRG